MNIYKLSQDIKTDYPYAYNSAIVVAKNEEQAKRIHPNGEHKWDDTAEGWNFIDRSRLIESVDIIFEWCTLKAVKVEYIGKSIYIKEPGVILASRREHRIKCNRCITSD